MVSFRCFKLESKKRVVLDSKIYTIILAFLLIAIPLYADDNILQTNVNIVHNSYPNSFGNSFLSSENISGNWGGLRGKLATKGVEFEFAYSGEIFSNVSGGVDQKTIYHDNFDLITAINAELLLGVKGGEFRFYFLGNSGDSPSANIGDMQTASNIDTDPAWKLYEVWYQQRFMDDRLRVLIGLYDLNSEFDVVETGGLFLNSSHGIGPDFSQSGQNGPSIFPVTSIALRCQYTVNDKITAQAAIFDGVPGDPEKISGTHLKFDETDGYLTVGEIYYMNDGESGPFCKYSIGYWMYSEEFEEKKDPSQSGTGNSGFYGMAEKQIFREDESGSQGLAAFTRIGFANSTYNQIGNYIGFGAAYAGLLPGRDEDIIGMGVAIASNGKDFKDSIEAANAEIDNSEIDVEFTYNTNILPWLNAQADIQYVINPGTDPDLDNALAAGLRFTINF
jgi:porin